MDSNLYSISNNASTESLSLSHQKNEIRNSIELPDNTTDSKPIIDDIRVVVSIDFGTTSSGYAYAHIYDNEGRDDTNFDYNTCEKWLKTNTALLYDKEFNDVLEWGEEALKGVIDSTSRPVELFKLGLSKLELGLNKLEIGSSKLIKNLKLNLPTQLHPVEEQRYKRAITDYLKKMGELIEEGISEHWPGITLKNVRWILTIPVVYSYRSKQIMRECAFKANLTSEIESDKLQFITEPEAAAIYCMTKNSLKKFFLGKDESNFLIIDCGGGTVDLTMRKLLSNCEVALSEVTECTGDFCGSVFIDQEFLKFLGEIVGHDAIELLCEKNYGQMQYLIRVFCQEVKTKYTGEENFSYEFDLGRVCQALKNHVTGEINLFLDKKDWIIKICGNDVKKMFDPVIERITQLVRLQLQNCRNTCSAIFMVGGFGASRYLQERIKKEFKNDVKYILTPPKPVAAVVSGAIVYGLRNNANASVKVPLSGPIILDRVLKYTYGTNILRSNEFSILANRGAQARIDQKFESTFVPLIPNQSTMSFKIYITQNNEPKYCYEEGVQFLGELKVNLPDIDLGLNRPVKFSICFAEEELKVFAVNLQNGQNCHATFILDSEL
ncbi:actin-like ATPase domain-containing protein [Gigaspora margarita]|uniref:Actin-like ATPase domain-containing protein n=1 Tax=Gigaspora margarita TaxID=4874 RepID=A0A8H4EU92_GIGMA|nr:actin-like ATPase domain-containing protein [Gigaspora margarita]